MRKQKQALNFPVSGKKFATHIGTKRQSAKKCMRNVLLKLQLGGNHYEQGRQSKAEINQGSSNSFIIRSVNSTPFFIGCSKTAGIYYFTQKETIYYQNVERVYNYSFEEFEKKCKELTQKILGHDENWKDSFDESLKIIRNLHYGSCYAVESRCIILAMNVCHDLLECKVIDEENRKKLEREVEALRGQNTYEDLKKKFKSIMERFVNECVFYKGNQENDSIFKVKEYISEHFSEDITLEKMAQMVYMNPYYFSAFFKKETGENFKAYLLEVRMKKALQYLMETNMKTYELASQVGYKDVRTFTDKFRDFYGCSPAKYKKNNR